VSIFLQVLGLLPVLLPLVRGSVEAVGGLVTAIQGMQGLSPEQVAALVAVVRADLAAENQRVQGVPVARP
jgi:hypothetical protein